MVSQTLVLVWGNAVPGNTIHDPILKSITEYVMKHKHTLFVNLPFRAGEDLGHAQVVCRLAP